MLYIVIRKVAKIVRSINNAYICICIVYLLTFIYGVARHMNIFMFEVVAKFSLCRIMASCFTTINS